MKSWDWLQLRTALKAKWVWRGTRAHTGRVVTDSRYVQPGDLFFALVGETHDAHTFLVDVMARQAGGVVVHQNLTPEQQESAQRLGVYVLQVDNTIAALNRLASAWRQELRARVVAVSGSNGKTTAKRIIQALLTQKMTGVASPKSFNNNIGMPLTLLDAGVNAEYVVLEVGTNHPGEIAALAEVARPDVAVITSLGLEHLEGLGSLAGVAQEEAAIAEFVPAEGTLIIPAAAPELHAFLKRAVAQRITFGLAGSGADLEATDITMTAAGCTFGFNGRGHYTLPLLGRHNVLNGLAAIAVARRLGLSEELIAAGLTEVKPADMRLELQTLAGHLVINDAYNANPTSMEAALDTLMEFSHPGRKVAVLGDMRELGVQAPQWHRHVGAYAARVGVQVLITAGPLMQEAADAALAQGVSVHACADAPAAGEQLLRVLQPDDLILLKGSRGTRMERALEPLRQQATPSQTLQVMQ
jgi:UDP-N-acetylmuramoyl-tripeptide--D-alanyl-D-alanine ligase